MAFHVVVTGSRDLRSSTLVFDALGELFATHGPLQVHVGDCESGADLFAREWAERHPGPQPIVYSADWQRFGRPAGPIRNIRMVEAAAKAGARLCLAFWQAGAANKGTAGCVALAEAAGIEVVRYGRTPAEQAKQEELPL